MVCAWIRVRAWSSLLSLSCVLGKGNILARCLLQMNLNNTRSPNKALSSLIVQHGNIFLNHSIKQKDGRYQTIRMKWVLLMKEATIVNTFNGVILLREFRFQEEREARELVKREQDEAYQASLRQDRAKVVSFHMFRSQQDAHRSLYFAATLQITIFVISFQWEGNLT